MVRLAWSGAAGPHATLASESTSEAASSRIVNRRMVPPPLLRTPALSVSAASGGDPHRLRWARLQDGCGGRCAGIAYGDRDGGARLLLGGDIDRVVRYEWPASGAVIADHIERRELGRTQRRMSTGCRECVLYFW